jgi:anti-sigma factor RsiW
MSLFRRRKPTDDVDCQDFVELVTDYLEGVLPAGLRARIDDHLVDCPGCARTLEQWKVVVSMAGRLAPTDVDAIDPETRAELLQAFRDAETK